MSERKTPSEAKRRPRALFYSHDSLGLGHLRRTLLICEGLRSRFQDLSTLILTGSAMAHAMRMPHGVDYIKLPSVFKVDNERYRARSLNVPFEQIWELRQQIIYQTTLKYRPDFFFVDNVPMGMKKEVLPALCYLRAKLPETRSFLVLRDILDDKNNIVPFWTEEGGYEALEELYDRIFVCGSSNLFDPTREYRFPPSVIVKTRFCGYISRESPNGKAGEIRSRHCPNGEKLVLVTLGGGSDGAHVIENYLAALPRVTRECPTASIIIMGPDMNERETCRLRSKCPKGAAVTFLDFSMDPLSYMEAADSVVSMGGYNTISEILWLKKNSVVIPRTYPRREQLIRSRLLHERKLIDMIHPEELTPESLGEKVVKSLAATFPSESPLSFTAIARLTAELQPYIQKNRLQKDQEGLAL